jgi:acylphosphatase
MPVWRVEVVDEGERDAMVEFKKDLSTVPSLAEVSDIEETDLPVTGLYRDFRVDY